MELGSGTHRDMVSLQLKGNRPPGSGLLFTITAVAFENGTGLEDWARIGYPSESCIPLVHSAGVKAFEPGLLAKANRGILYVDEVNLLDDHLVDVLLDSAASGWNTVEREGISISHPARFILVGSGESAGNSPIVESVLWVDAGRASLQCTGLISV